MSSPSLPRRRRTRAGVAIGAFGAATVLGALVAPGPAGATARAPQPTLKTSIVADVLYVDGGRVADVIAIGVPAAKPHLLDIDLADDGTVDQSILRSRFDSIVMRGRGGNDTLLVDSASAPFDEPVSLRGNGGDDTLLGGLADDDLVGGPGRDVIDGNRGADAANLGAGDDTFVWDPGDGNDTIEGRAGTDTMRFNGSDQSETFTVDAFGDRLRFTRSVGNIVMDADSVEAIDLNVLGGGDFTDVRDVRKTDVTTLDISYGATADSATPDGVTDYTTVVGTRRPDQVTLTGSAGATEVAGLKPAVSITGADPFDSLTVYTGRGADRIDASALAADATRLTMLAAEGNDTVLGGAGNDIVLAGEGNDLVDTNRGDDDAHLDEGDDTFVWDPGDGSDLVYGDADYDTMTFNGSGQDEVFEAFANGYGLLFYRDVGDIAMNTEGLEQLDVNPLGGADRLTVDDLSGTTTSAVTADLAPSLGAVGGDGSVDSVTVKGSPEDDAIEVSGGEGGAVHVERYGQTFDLSNAEPTDSLTIDGNGGVDEVDSTGLLAGSILFQVL